MASPAQSPPVICFGQFELDPAVGELRKAGIPLKIHPQPFRVLLLLAEHPRHVVTREEIQRCLWGDNTFVDFERGINSCVNQLRTVLGDDPENPRYIETLPRKGYRFVAAVTCKQQAELPGALRSAGAPSATAPPGSAGSGLHLVVPEPATQDGSRAKFRGVLFAVGCLEVLLFALVWYSTRTPSYSLPDPVLTQLTANSTENAVTGGSISPDGQYLAYADAAGIHIKLIKTGDTRDLPQPEELKNTHVNWVIASGWAREASRVIATANVPGKPPSIWSIPVLGGSPRKIREDGTASSVTRDGSLVAFTTNTSEIGDDREVWIISPDGEHAQKLFEGDSENTFGDPIWSPDGKRIAYVRHHQHGENVDFSFDDRDLHGSAARQILPTWVWDANWLTGGRLIYSLHDPGPIGESCSFWGAKLNPQTGEVGEASKRLTHWAGACMDNLSATNDGRRLAFRKMALQGDVYVADILEGGAHISPPQRLTLTEGRSYPAAWTPDSSAVIFGGYRDGQWGLFSQKLGADKPEFLATVADAQHLSDYGLDDFWSAGARVSPDGAWILFLSAPPEVSSTASTATPTQLMRVPITGGAAEVVLTDHAWAGLGCARPPSNLCAIGEETPDRKQLVFTAVDAVHGRSRELARIAIDPVRRVPGDYSWDISPDGSTIAVLHESEPTVQLLSLRGAARRSLSARGWDKFQTLNWAADSKGLIVSSATESGVALLHLDLNGKAHKIFEVKGNLQPASVPLDAPWGVPSPDGRHIAIFEGSMSSNIWMMENF